MVKYSLTHLPPEPGPRSDLDAFVALNRTDDRALMALRDALEDVHDATGVSVEIRPDSAEAYRTHQLSYRRPALQWARYQSSLRPEHVVGDNPLDLLQPTQFEAEPYDPYKEFSDTARSLQFEFEKLRITPPRQVHNFEERLAHVTDSGSRLARRFGDLLHTVHALHGTVAMPAGTQDVDKQRARLQLFRHLADEDGEIVLGHDNLHTYAHDYDALVRTALRRGVTETDYRQWTQEQMRKALPTAIDLAKRVGTLGVKAAYAYAEVTRSSY